MKKKSKIDLKKILKRALGVVIVYALLTIFITLASNAAPTLELRIISSACFTCSGLCANSRSYGFSY